ncbi:hypothetical protein JS84_24825 [Vibrio vulnificus]|nr:hypothetical protein JS84_24825 [Vibrio vulnificus]
MLSILGNLAFTEYFFFSAARNQIRDTLSQLGLHIIECRDGLEALNLLKSWCDEGKEFTPFLLPLVGIFLNETHEILGLNPTASPSDQSTSLRSHV